LCGGTTDDQLSDTMAIFIAEGGFTSF
jgi:hypothetical protein